MQSPPSVGPKKSIGIVKMAQYQRRLLVVDVTDVVIVNTQKIVKIRFRQFVVFDRGNSYVQRGKPFKMKPFTDCSDWLWQRKREENDKCAHTEFQMKRIFAINAFSSSFYGASVICVANGCFVFNIFSVRSWFFTTRRLICWLFWRDLTALTCIRIHRTQERHMFRQPHRSAWSLLNR